MNYNFNMASRICRIFGRYNAKQTMLLAFNTIGIIIGKL